MKLSIRELYKQQRDAEIAEKERTKAVEMAAANPDNDGQARKQRVLEERAKFTSNAAAWFQREKQRTRKAYLKKCGMVAALVAVVVSAFLLLKPATLPQIAEEKPLSRTYTPTVADMVNFEMAMKLSDLGLDVELIVNDDGTMVGTREKAYSPADRDTVVKKLMAQGVKIEFVSRANVDAVEVAKEKKGTLIVFTD